MRGNKTKTGAQEDVNAGLDEQMLSQRIDALAALAEQLEGRSTGVKQDLLRLDDNQNNLSKASEELSRRIVGLADKNAELERAVREASELSQDAENRIESITGGFPAADARTAELRKQIGQLKSQGTQRSQRLSALNKRIKGVESSLEAAAESNTALAQRLDAFDSQNEAFSAFDQGLEGVRSELASLEQRFAGLDQSGEQAAVLAAMDEKLDALEARITVGNDTGKDSLTALEQRIEYVSRDQTSLEQQIVGLADDTGAMAEALDAMREQSVELMSKLPDMQPVLERLSALEQGTEPLAEQQQSQQVAIHELNERLDSLKTQSQETVQAVAEGADKVGAFKEQMARFDELLANDKATSETVLNERFDTLDQRLGAFDEARDQLEERFETTLDAIAELKNRTDGLRTQLSALETTHAEFAGLGSQNTGLMQTQEAQKNELLTLRGRLESLAEAVHETTELIGQEAEKLAAIGQRAEAESMQLHRLAQKQAEQLDESQALETRVDGLAGAQARQVEASQQALGGLEQRFDTLSESLRLFDDTGKTLGGRIDSASEALSGLQLRTSDLFERLQHLADVPERLTGLESRRHPVEGQLDEHGNVLTRLEQRVDELNQARESLNQRLDEEAGRISSHARHSASSSEKILDLQRLIDGLKNDVSGLQQGQQQEIQTLNSQLGDMGAGQDRLAEENRQLISALREQLEQLGEDQGKLAAAGQSLAARLDTTDGDVQTLHSATEVLAERAAGLDDLPGRITQLEQQSAPITATLSEHGEALTDVKNLLAELQRSTGELSERVSAEAERLEHRQTENQEANQSRMAVLAEEISACREALSLAESKIGDLGGADGRLQSELQETARRIADLAKQDQHRLSMIEAAQARLDNVDTLLESRAETLDRIQQVDREQNDKIASVQTGQRVLTWAGVVAALLLIGMSLVGYLLSEDKQQTIRQALMEQLGSLETRLSSSALGNPEQLKSLAEDMSDLKLHVRTLDSRFDDLPIAEPAFASAEPSLDETEMQQLNIMQAMDELSARLAAIEEAPTTTRGQVSNAVLSKPATRALAVSAADNWSQAQSQGRYTLQIVGVRDRASLDRFVQSFRLKEDTAYMETRFKGNPWYVLFHGIYNTRAKASTAATQLAGSLGAGKPWIRRLPKTGRIQALE